MIFPFVPLPITVLIFLHDMEHLREWNNVNYVPMKVLRDPNRKWLSALILAPLAGIVGM